MNDRYNFLKAHGICVQCGQRDAFQGYVRCPECIEKTAIASAKCWEDEEKRKKYRKRGKERSKQLRKEKKSKHMCTICGKKLPEYYKYCTCISCRKRRSDKRRTGRDYGEAFRERIEAGVCMYCGDKTVEGYKLCKKHLEAARINMKKNSATASNKWRGEITRQWENAKLKNSRNG